LIKIKYYNIIVYYNMSIVGLYSKIQYLEAVINEVKNAQVSGASSVAGVNGVHGVNGVVVEGASGVPEEKVIDLTQLNEFNELSEKVKALEVVDGELSTKIAEVPALLSSYVPSAYFAALNAKVEKMDKLNNQMDKLNSKLDSLISKVSSLESKVATLESNTSA
jgi:outer membrane murein-binding lipoprotein Lpp